MANEQRGEPQVGDRAPEFNLDVGDEKLALGGTENHRLKGGGFLSV
jgi:hypothetical protein